MEATMMEEVPELANELPAAPESAEWLIRASGLRKKYCRDLRRSLWYSLCDMAGGLGLRQTDIEQLREHEFWAVDDISFELRRGDSLGLLGRNGAGKSTLLKLLTGQRTLTAGKVMTRGRIVALTELGLGFDPVLTGRENAYVNAAVHGVSRRDFDRVLEKIIDFSELREFIDSAVHTYSSGMKARLGFSVATHLEPDILIVDEVLAVGDLEFRRKCVKHVLAYLRAGGSVVLVAHDPYLVQSICNRVIVLERGIVIFDGSSVEGVDLHFRMGHANQYAAAVSTTQTVPTAIEATASAEEESSAADVLQPELGAGRETGQGEGSFAGSSYMALTENRPVVIDGISVAPVRGDCLRTGEPAKISFHCRSLVDTEVGWGFSICTRDLQVNIASSAIGFDGEVCPLLQPGKNTLSCVLPELTLRAGVYAIRGGIGDAKNKAPIAAFGYEESPHFFTVSTPKVSRINNWQSLMDDLVTMKVEWL